ncbi:ABC transporter ATP-binding protein [Glaciihabitans arcticus]|nr:ABC transporter ATP-binding protein [Glaciihabitans arcticus]
MSDPLLSVADLRIALPNGTELVRGVSFSVERGGSLGIVGESGSGKSLTCRAVLGIVPEGVAVTSGDLAFDGVDLRSLSYEQWMPLRGRRISAVFQDPGSYLNPSIPVGRQLAEALRASSVLTRKEARTRAVELFASLGLRDPHRVAGQYPHELSGGMLQRVLIAIAICADPQLLIADEATTALDVTVQAEVLDVLADLAVTRDLAIVLVSHDLAVVAQVCENVVVMRDGVIVEAGRTAEVLGNPQHEYTQLLVTDHERYGIENYLAARELLHV